MKKLQAKRFTLIAEKCGFNVEEPQQQGKEWYIELQQYTPAGEDWWVTVWFDEPNGILESVESLYADFDVDDEAEKWIEGRGKNGVPSSIKVLVEDQEWKEEKLHELCLTLQRSPMDKTDANRLVNSIEAERFAFERYTGNGRTWYNHHIMVEPVFCSYGQMGWQIIVNGKEFCMYDYEKKEITLN